MMVRSSSLHALQDEPLAFHGSPRLFNGSTPWVRAAGKANGGVRYRQKTKSARGRGGEKTKRPAACVCQAPAIWCCLWAIPEHIQKRRRPAKSGNHTAQRIVRAARFIITLEMMGM